MAIHYSPNLAIGIENIDSPSLVVDLDGVIQALNHAVVALIPGIGAAHSLLSLCLDHHQRLRRYLIRCSAAAAPVFEEFTFEGNLRFRCLGRLLAPETADRPATVLLRLLPAETRISFPAEPMHSALAGRRLRLAAAECDELRAERTRILRQYLVMAEALQTLEQQNRELQQDLRSARTEERERIAHDIHDQAGQELSAAIAEIRQLREHVQAPQRARIDALEHLLSDVGRRLHRAVVGCVPRIVEELGLFQALRVTVAAYAADGGLKFSFSTSGKEPRPFPPQAASALYRVAQEAMTNVLKHAKGCSKLDVHLTLRAGTMSLTVADDGIGFSPVPEGRDGEHLGLPGMRRRMAGIGGTLHLASSPGCGTTVEARAPLATPALAGAPTRDLRQ